MARIKVVPRKPPSWALKPRPLPPSSASTIQDASSNPQDLSDKKETRPTSSQEPQCTTKNDAERRKDDKGKKHALTKNDAERRKDDKGKKHALETPTKDDFQRELNEDDDDPHAKLLDELRIFQQWGLMTKRDPNSVSPSEDDDDEAPSYGLEVTRRYPNFFLLIPQFPHYQGLLHDGVDEGIKKTVYQALWCKLVDLMDKALQTNCLSRPREIKEMMEEARGLEKLGFDVRHLMARLEQPSRSIFGLTLANDKLRLAKKRKHEMEEQITELDMLEPEADKLKKMLLDVDARVSRLKAKVGSNEERAALLKSLRKEVEDAEKSFRAKLDIFKSLD